MEDIIIRRRNRARSRFTITSNVLLFGYPHLSDGAKLTYQVIDSFDWTDAAGTRKGFAHPSLGRLAKIRGIARRSVRRHLADLESSRLITRVERPGRPSLLIIEDPSEDETERYVREVAGLGEDKIVLPTPDKSVRPYKKEEEQKKDESNIVNEEETLLEDGTEARPAEHIGRIIRELGQRQRERPVSMRPVVKREYLAREMANVLHDEHSLGFYRKVAEHVPAHGIFEALSIVKQMSREGSIRKSRGAAFTSIIKAQTPTGIEQGDAYLLPIRTDRR